MTVRIAINGFGRIGRLVLRAILEQDRKDVEVVAINDLAPADVGAYLLNFDSVHGSLSSLAEIKGSQLHVGDHKIEMLCERSPKNLPWKALNIDIVMECSGIFTKRADAAGHLEAGAKKVLISAPSPDADKTIVYGVNQQTLTADDVIVSNASCTTNCLAPVAAVLDSSVGISRGYMTTIHAYTGDQSLVDTAHKDPRRARAGAISMIPTSTGAAKAVGLVLPSLMGKLDGTAIRVPTPNVSLIDFTFDAENHTTKEAINDAIQKAASAGPLQGILGANTLPLVSTDFNHSPFSSVFDVTQTQVVEGTFCRILAWYDNEWGFSNRMSDVAVYMSKL